jgi:hypothetical protein
VANSQADDPEEPEIIRTIQSAKHRRNAELNTTEACKYRSKDIQRAHGLEEDDVDATRMLWKMKFVKCWKEYRDKFRPNIQDDTVTHFDTAFSYYLEREPAAHSTRKRKGPSKQSIPFEVDRFFSQTANLGPTMPKNQCPLAWWKANEKVYPVLALMARDILAIPCSAAEPERVHSQARTVLNWNQSRMGHKAVEASVMLKCAVLYNKGYGALDKDQLAKLEDVENSFALSP